MKKLFLSLFAVAAVQLSAVEFTGPDKFWRPRENIMFYLNDDSGSGFSLKLDMRDMNTYSDGARPAYAFLIAPDGTVSDRRFMPDDGVVRGKPEHKDGIADIFMDFRYREFHRMNSPGRTAPGKTRSPFLSNPEKLPARSFTLNGAKQKGVHRLVIAGCWDHWFSVTPSRVMASAIHPGQGGVYAHGNQLADMWVYIPEETKQLNVALSEEVEPFNWTVESDEFTIRPKHFLNYAHVVPKQKNKAMRFSVKGKTTGAMFHLSGAPMLLCSDRKTAELFRGGVKEPSLSILERYVPKNQIETDFMRRALRFYQTFTFAYREGIGVEFKPGLWNFRSSWWDFGDGNFKKYPENLPSEVKAALTDLLEKWCMNRYVMEMGACTNQWAKILEQMAQMYDFTQSPIIKEVLTFNTRRICSENSLGRTNPDRDSWKSGYESDYGYMACGIMGEALGHDNEYNLETESHLTRVYKSLPLPEILAWQEAYYRFKTHHTISKTGFAPGNTFAGTCSPTDSNSRTRCYTHKAPALTNQILYGDLWGGKENPRKTVWPFLEKASFVREIGGRYAFLKTPAFYLEFYLGPSFPFWQSWAAAETDGSSVRLVGFSGMGYGGRGYFAAKPGGISALWVPEFGPAILGSNHDSMYTNTLWGRSFEAWGRNAAANVDPHMVSESASDCVVSFDAAKRVLKRSGKILRTPLFFERTVSVSDDFVRTEVVIRAEKDFRMKDFYESVPLFIDGLEWSADGRRIVPLTGKNETFAAKNIMLRSQNGRTVQIQFDLEYEFETAPVLKYRREASSMTGISAKLPSDWEKGQTFRILYEIKF